MPVLWRDPTYGLINRFHPPVSREMTQAAAIPGPAIVTTTVTSALQHVSTCWQPSRRGGAWTPVRDVSLLEG
jgi:hypothetical protein